ncbi:MAG: hypothetical protein HY319_29320 [Armatimonadetes bacterium]|nr:hypothetical protein [Armatimonadota bacterium]
MKIIASAQKAPGQARQRSRPAHRGAPPHGGEDRVQLSRSGRGWDRARETTSLRLVAGDTRTVDLPDLRFHKVDHVVVQNHNDPELLLKILKSPDMPRGATVVTTELSLLPLDGPLKSRLESLYDLSQACKKDSGLAEQLERDRKQLRDELVDFYAGNAATGGVPREFLEVARQKELTLWLGLPRYEAKTERLYNSLVCVRNGRVVDHHDKTLLWAGSPDLKVSDTLVFSPAERWDDHRNDYHTALICWEAFNINQSFGKPTRMPGVAEEFAQVPSDQFGIAYISAYAPVNDGRALRSSMGRFVRRDDDKNITLGPHGGLAFIANGPVEAAIMGPYEEPESPHRKADLYGSTRADGIIHARSLKNGQLEVRCYTVSA